MTLTLEEILRATQGRLEAAGAAAPQLVSGYSTDSRTLQPGDLFFALHGERFDGHDYVDAAMRRGAAAAIVERPQSCPLPQIVVDDVLGALHSLAASARRKWGGTVVGITGSAGKTTTKEAVAACLSVVLTVSRSAGNLNNHIGLPLSMLRVSEQAHVAVLEYAMNHAGEIRRLAEIVPPDVAVVTNVGYAHIENFDSIEGIAAAKRELVEALSPRGVAVLNADDVRVREFARSHPGRTVFFGFGEDAEVRGEILETGLEGSRFRVQGVEFQTSLPGRHGVRNVLAAIAVAQVFGIPVERLPAAVAQLRVGAMRGEILRRNGVTIINDCYNSNPDAVREMLDLLRDLPAERRIAVLGEMLELGRWSEALHRQVGRYAAECGVSVLVGIRGGARYMVDAAMAARLPGHAAYFFPEPEPAGEALRGLVQPGDAVLFKGSRGTHVERALERFLA
jgi:UDP-N-acetylmuramoyl-tripeptide--D-alanyl-D-alanine ligase